VMVLGECFEVGVLEEKLRIEVGMLVNSFPSSVLVCLYAPRSWVA
jgi:hypothetical protein